MNRWMRGVLIVLVAVVIPACGSKGDTFILNVLPVPTSATLLYVGPGEVLINVEPAAPDVILSAIPLKDLQGGETIRAIDYRRSPDELYALGSSGRLYRVDPQTGQCSTVGSPVTGLTGTAFGMDVDPVGDRIRVVGDAEENISLDPLGGPQQSHPALNWGAPNPAIVACAYDSSAALYGLESGADILVLIDPATGALTARPALGVDVSNAAGFDITAANQAYAALEVGGVTRLYTLNLTTGAATLVGTLGTGGPIRGFTSVP